MLRQSWSWPSRETWALIVTALIAILIVTVNEWSFQRSAKSRAILMQNTATREQITDLLQSLTDAGLAQRGYLLSEDTLFLARYQQADKNIDAPLAYLRAQYKIEPAQRNLIAKIAQLSLDMRGDLAILLKLREQATRDVWLENMLLMRGKVALDAIRSNVKQLYDNELGDLTKERVRMQKTMDFTRIGVHTLTLVGLLGYALFLDHIAKFKAQGREHALALEAQRNELEIAVLRRTEELSELTLHLQTAREDERAHVARELHDELGALLTAAKFDTARLKRSLGKMEPDVEDRVNHLNQTINQGIALKRRIIEDLHPSALTNLGLVAALEIQAREFEERSGLTLKLALDVKHAPLSSEVKLTVYRLVQESLTNIAKYAKASEVQIKLRVEDANVVVTVIDNGCGFNPSAVLKSSHGLTGMRYRVESQGGKIRVNSSVGNGTQIEAWLPTKI